VCEEVVKRSKEMRSYHQDADCPRDVGSAGSGDGQGGRDRLRCGKGQRWQKSDRESSKRNQEIKALDNRGPGEGKEAEHGDDGVGRTGAGIFEQ
jgi:hypothetical protein